MNLKFRFPGFLLKDCEIYHDNQKVGSLKQTWSFFQHALAQYNNYEWEIKEKGFIKTKVQVFDKINKKFIGEVNINDKNNLLEIVGVKPQQIATMKTGKYLYRLVVNPNLRSQYTWLNEDGDKFIYYDLTNLENAVFYSFKYNNREGVATLPDNPSNEQLSLFFLGIFLLRLRILRFAA